MYIDTTFLTLDLIHKSPHEVHAWSCLSQGKRHGGSPCKDLSKKNSYQSSKVLLHIYLLPYTSHLVRTTSLLKPRCSYNMETRTQYHHRPHTITQKLKIKYLPTGRNPLSIISIDVPIYLLKPLSAFTLFLSSAHCIS